MKSYGRAIAIFTVVFAAVGCISNPSDADSPDFFDTIWILERVEGFSPLHDSVNVHLIFSVMDGRSSGRGRTICNQYGFEAEFRPARRVSIGPHFQTKVGCGMWNDLEDVYFGQLRSSYRFKLDDGYLSFYNPEGQEVVRYRAGTPADTTPRLGR